MEVPINATPKLLAGKLMERNIARGSQDNNQKIPLLVIIESFIEKNLRIK